MSGPPRKRRRLSATMSIDVAGAVELHYLYRRDLARLLRDAAVDEAPAVAARLREIAALFETGLPAT